MTRVGDGRKIVVRDAGAETSTHAPVLEIRGLSVTFPRRSTVEVGRPAVTGFDIDVHKGERVAVVGESGSGKSTACLAIAGLLSVDGTSVAVDVARFQGAPLTVRPPVGTLPVKQPGVAMIFQDAMNSLDPVWRVGSQFRAVLQARGKAPKTDQRDRAAEWLSRVGLRDTGRVLRSRPFELSGGMRQRVMLALAMASEPSLLIADEPTSALDASLAVETLELITSICAERGTALLVVSHDIRLVERYCDRTIVMYGGYIVEAGTSATLRAHSRHPYTVGLHESVPSLRHEAAAVMPTIPSAKAPRPDIAADGCVFSNRCQRASPLCKEVPQPRTDEDGHQVSCWHPIERDGAQ